MGHHILIKGGQAILSFPERIDAQHIPRGRAFDEVELEVEELLPVASLQLDAVPQQRQVVGHVVPPRPAIVPEVEANAVGCDVAVELIAVDDLERHTEVVEGVVDHLGDFAGHRMGHGVPEERDGHRLARRVVIGQVGHGDRVALHLPRGQAHGRHGMEVQDGPVGHELEVIAAGKSDVGAEWSLTPFEALAAGGGPA